MTSRLTYAVVELEYLQGFPTFALAVESILLKGHLCYMDILFLLEKDVD